MSFISSPSSTDTEISPQKPIWHRHSEELLYEIKNKSKGLFGIKFEQFFLNLEDNHEFMPLLLFSYRMDKMNLKLGIKKRS